MFRRGLFAAILATPVFAALLLNSASAAEKKDMVIMGCLTSGGQPDEYQIKTDDKTYVMVGHKEKLAKHVGHIVTLSGHVDTEREKQAAAKPGDVDRFKISSWTKTGSACP
ncbi:MAG TPA: hypothetical protein VIX89_12620 [Bryobacteraceae bacterium]